MTPLAAIEPHAAHRRIVQRDAAEIEERAHQRDGETRVVELAVVVERAAAQRVAVQMVREHRRFFARFGETEAAARGEIERTREPVVDLEPRAVEQPVGGPVGGHDEAERAHQMRRIAREQAALAQRFAHERDIALREIAHAAVHELRGLARRAFGEIARFQQQGAVAARRRIDGRAEAARPAADHDDIEDRRAVQFAQQRCALGWSRRLHVSA